MSIAYIFPKTGPDAGTNFLAEIVEITPGSPPERPHPTPPDDGAHPSHPIALPGDPWWGDDLRPEHPIVIPPPAPAEPTLQWVFVPAAEGKPGGWYRAVGPFDKPRPVPPELAGENGQWMKKEEGLYYVTGPYDKPKPPGGVPPEQPPVPPSASAKWVHGPHGWSLVIGPFDKPKPIGPGKK